MYVSTVFRTVVKYFSVLFFMILHFVVERLSVNRHDGRLQSGHMPWGVHLSGSFHVLSLRATSAIHPAAPREFLQRISSSHGTVHKSPARSAGFGSCEASRVLKGRLIGHADRFSSQEKPCLYPCFRFASIHVTQMKTIPLVVMLGDSVQNGVKQVPDKR